MELRCRRNRERDAPDDRRSTAWQQDGQEDEAEHEREPRVEVAKQHGDRERIDERGKRDRREHDAVADLSEPVGDDRKTDSSSDGPCPEHDPEREGRERNQRLGHERGIRVEEPLGHEGATRRSTRIERRPVPPAAGGIDQETQVVPRPRRNHRGELRRDDDEPDPAGNANDDPDCR